MRKIRQLIQMVDKDMMLHLLQSYKRYVAASVCLLLVVCYFFISRFSSDRKIDYYTTELVFSTWSQESSSRPDLLEKVEKSLLSHPELYARYGAKIVQRLIEKGETAQLERYLPHLEKKKEELSTIERDFAKISLSIANGQLTEALIQSQHLKKLMDEKKLHNSLIYAYQLLRIAVLEQKVGTLEGERQAWEALLKDRTDQQLEVFFKDQKLTLKDYIDHRLNYELSNIS